MEGNNPNQAKFSLNEEQKNLLKEAFDLFDMEKTNKIDFHELKLTFKAFGFKLSEEEKEELMGRLEQGENYKVDYNTFMDEMRKKFAERNPREEASLAFDLFDEDKKGKINLKNLKKAVNEINETLSDQDLKAILDEFDLDGDGYIGKDEFLKVMDEYYFN